MSVVLEVGPSGWFRCAGAGLGLVVARLGERTERLAVLAATMPPNMDVSATLRTLAAVDAGCSGFLERSCH